jgi:L-histidine Nalpha-methyltransferase
VSVEIKTLDSVDMLEINTLEHEFALDVLHGLSETRKRLSSKYFYDNEGSNLFQKLTTLDEYYPTECEREILEHNKSFISSLLNRDEFNLIELGAGDGHKTKILIQQLIEDGNAFNYIPVDISESAMKDLTESMRSEFENIEIKGIVAEYFESINWLTKISEKHNVVLFMGSNIGNFTAADSRTFLRELWNVLNPDDLVIIGFDLKKDIDIMHRAYNDSKGITRDFNLNLLHRINNELGGNFDVSKFRHYSTYDVFSGAMESYLVSLERQTVYIRELSQTFEFDPYEPVHTEYSYKYLESDIEELASNTGFKIIHRLYDSKHWFTNSIWSVEKQQ